MRLNLCNSIISKKNASILKWDQKELMRLKSRSAIQGQGLPKKLFIRPLPRFLRQKPMDVVWVLPFVGRLLKLMAVSLQLILMRQIIVGYDFRYRSLTLFKKEVKYVHT